MNKNELIMESEIGKYTRMHPELNKDEVKALIDDEYRFDKYKMSGLANNNIDIIKAFDNGYGNRKKSDVIDATLDKDDNVKGTVLDEEYYSKLLNYVKDLSRKYEDEIREGNIEINPCEKSCDYCDFKNICRFDLKMNDKYREIERINKNNIKEKLDEIYGKDSDGGNHGVD